MELEGSRTSLQRCDGVAPCTTIVNINAFDKNVDNITAGGDEDCGCNSITLAGTVCAIVCLRWFAIPMCSDRAHHHQTPSVKKFVSAAARLLHRSTQLSPKMVSSGKFSRFSQAVARPCLPAVVRYRPFCQGSGFVSRQRCFTTLISPKMRN